MSGISLMMSCAPAQYGTYGGVCASGVRTRSAAGTGGQSATVAAAGGTVETGAGEALDTGALMRRWETDPAAYMARSRIQYINSSSGVWPAKLPSSDAFGDHAHAKVNGGDIEAQRVHYRTPLGAEMTQQGSKLHLSAPVNGGDIEAQKVHYRTPLGAEMARQGSKLHLSAPVNGGEISAPRVHYKPPLTAEMAEKGEKLHAFALVNGGTPGDMDSASGQGQHFSAVA